MKRMGLIKRALILAVCGILAVPAAMVGPQPTMREVAATDSNADLDAVK